NSSDGSTNTGDGFRSAGASFSGDGGNGNGHLIKRQARCSGKWRKPANGRAQLRNGGLAQLHRREEGVSVSARLVSRCPEGVHGANQRRCGIAKISLTGNGRVFSRRNQFKRVLVVHTRRDRAISGAGDLIE